MEAAVQQASRLALRYDPPAGSGAARGAAAANAAAGADSGGVAVCAAEAQYNPVARRAAGLAPPPPRGDSDSDAEEEPSADERQARVNGALQMGVGLRLCAALTRERHRRRRTCAPGTTGWRECSRRGAWRCARREDTRRGSRTVSRLTRCRRGRRRKRASCGGSSTRSTAFAPKGAPRRAAAAEHRAPSPVASRALLLS